jgi:DNA-binding NtrC family response regulator
MAVRVILAKSGDHCRSKARRDPTVTRAWGSFGLDPLPTMEAGVDRKVLMTTVHSAAPEHAAQSLAPNEIVPMLIGSTVGEIERELVLQTLARCDGNRTHAARMLGLSVRTLRNKIRQYSTEGSDVPRTRA